jgi:hypothetical protein
MANTLDKIDDLDLDLNGEEELVELPDAPATQFMPWHLPCEVDAIIKTFGADTGRNIAGDACPEAVVQLLKPVVSHREQGAKEVRFDPGDVVTITGGPTKLRRLMDQYADELQPGRRVVIKHLGLIKIAGGKTMRDFKLAVGHTYASLGLED